MTMKTMELCACMTSFKNFLIKIERKINMTKNLCGDFPKKVVLNLQN